MSKRVVGYHTITCMNDDCAYESTCVYKVLGDKSRVPELEIVHDEYIHTKIVCKDYCIEKLKPF